MSKPVKNLITASYKRRFGDLEGAVLIDVRGVKSNDNNKLRGRLSQKKIRVTVVKNSLAKRAFDGTALDPIMPMIEGSSAMVYGGESVVAVARELVDAIKEVPTVQLKGALMDGQVFLGPDQVTALSKYPTKGEAQGQVVQLLLSPGGKLVSAIKGPGGKLASIIKAIEEKLEKGETIAKKAG